MDSNALSFPISVDTRSAAALLPALFEAREQLALTPFGTSSLEHLLPVGEVGVSGYEVIERLRRKVLCAFDTACVEELAERLEIRCVPLNESNQALDP